MHIPEEDEISRIIDELRLGRRPQPASQRLSGLTFHPDGHRVASGHPFIPPNEDDAFARLRGGMYAACARMLEGLSPGQAFLVGEVARVHRLTSPCMRCGLVDWVVSAQDVRPLVPCPFPNGVIETRVLVPVPSGKLAVGRSLTRAGAPAAPEIDDRNGLFPVRTHYAAEFWARYGFAQFTLSDLSFRHVLRDGDAALALCDGPAIRGPKLGSALLAFACGDAARFFPAHQELRRANAIRRDLVLSSIGVPPGMYEVTLFHQPRRFEGAGAKRRVAVRIVRVDGVTRAPFSADPDADARAFLERHPWLGGAATEAALQAEAARFDGA